MSDVNIDVVLQMFRAGQLSLEETKRWIDLERDLAVLRGRMAETDSLQADIAAKIAAIEAP